MQPINYMLENRNPVDALFSGVAGYQTAKNNQITLQELQAKADYEQAARQGLQNLDFNDLNAVRQYAARFPDMSKGVNDYLGQLDDKERQGMLADMSKSISLLRSGDSANAAKLARDKALAYKNAGNAAKAAEYEQAASLIETHPEAALQSLSMSYAIALPKDAMGNYKDMLGANTPTVKDINSGGEIGGYVVDPVTGEVKYQKFTNTSVSPDAQLKSETDITTTGMNNDTSRYVSDNSKAASMYGSQMSAQASMYGADKSAQASMYGADAATQRSQMEAQSRERIEQAKLYYQQQQAEIQNRQGELKEAGGKMYVVYKDGSYKPALDAQGNHMVASSATAANSQGVKQQEESQRIQRVDTVLNDIEKLLPKATGSLGGTAIDKMAGAVGYSTEGATTTSQLQSLSGQLVALMPRMSGPQSDKDVLMYKQMAGQLDDSTKPIAQRMAALKTIRALNQKYAAMNGGGTQAQPKAANINSFFTGK